MSESSITVEGIIDLALRYLDEDDIVDVPKAGDLFAFFQREINDGSSLEDGDWSFGGYAICRGYEIDSTEKPAGKWIFMKYDMLVTFPPIESELKLQPPHIAKGSFSTPGSEFEIKIEKVVKDNRLDKSKDSTENEGKILKFPSSRK